ncbi:17992_t:CDS:2, partial [Gigaspora rosea]
EFSGTQRCTSLTNEDKLLPSQLYFLLNATAVTLFKRSQQDVSMKTPLSWVSARKSKVINPNIVKNLASIRRTFNCLSARKEFVPNREEFQTVAQKSANFSPDDVVEFIMIYAKPCIDVAIRAFVWNEKAIQHILRKFKKFKFSGKVILGGPQVSYVKKGIEKNYSYRYADIYIRGYAENKFYLLTKLIPPQRFIRWETQRECPFRCALCQHRESDVTIKRYQFPVSRIIQEAERIAKYSNIQNDAVLDPTFNSGPYYLVQLNYTIEMVLESGLQTTDSKEQARIDRPNNMKLVEKSIDFCFNQKVLVIHAFPLMLLRGTPLHENPLFTYEEWKEMSKIAESLECSIKNISKSFKEKHNAKQYFYYENNNSSGNI